MRPSSRSPQVVLEWGAADEHVRRRTRAKARSIGCESRVTLGWSTWEFQTSRGCRASGSFRPIPGRGGAVTSSPSVSIAWLPPSLDERAVCSTEGLASAEALEVGSGAKVCRRLLVSAPAGLTVPANLGS